MPNGKKGKSDHYRDPLPSRLRMLIKERDVTHEQLGQAVGVSRGSIGQYVNGDSTPKYDALIAIAKFFGVSTDYLLGLSSSRSVDISTREICDRANLTDDAFAALSTLSRSDIDRYFIANQIIETICQDSVFLDNIAKYFNANMEIVATVKPGPENDISRTSGALVQDPEGDEISFLRFKASNSFDRLFDAVTRDTFTRSRADLFKRAHPERFWKDADGNIAGPIWYVPARSGTGCYPAHMTFAQYEAEKKAMFAEEMIAEPYREQLTDLFTRAAIKYEYNGDEEQYNADQKTRQEARQEARKKMWETLDKNLYEVIEEAGEEDVE